MQPLLEVARTFSRTAREEIERGFEANKLREGPRRSGEGVERGGPGDGSDHAMRARGRTPLPGRDSHRDRREFLEEIGRSDLARDFTYFAERLHGDVFYVGASVTAETAGR